MDQRLFLRDIDDWELYAKGLEAHVGAWHEQLQSFLEQPLRRDAVLIVGEVQLDVARVLREAADRAERLRDENCLREADCLTEHHLYPDKA